MVVLKIIVAILLAALGICLLAFAAFGVYAIKYAIEQRKKEKEAEHRRQTEEERLARRTPEEKARDALSGITRARALLSLGIVFLPILIFIRHF